MNDTPLSSLERAIDAIHHTDATLIERRRVIPYFEGRRGQEVEVHTFELLDHRSATRCYAWKVGCEVIAVLGEGRIKTAFDAVRTSIRFDLLPGAA
jgi:hypothetical protein